FTVPNFGDPEGSFAGGAFTSAGERDLRGFNALEFWARASMPATLGLAGIGNDNTGNSLYGAQLTELPLTTIWERYVIPIPDPDKLSMERGLFEVAAGPIEGVGYELFIDEVQFINDPTITNARPAIGTQNVVTTVGSTVRVEGTTVTYDAGGREVTVQASPYYFNFGSSDASVATVAADGTITVVGTGTATITATLGSEAADGAVTVTAVEGPTEAAPTPTVPANQVISLFSNAYTDVTVDTWSADFDTADVDDIQIAGDDTKLYSNLGFAAIEFISEQIDATAMTHFHMDVWTFDSSEFKIKLVDFGPDGEFGGGDDSEHEVTLNESTIPAMTTGEWSVLDIPLSDFVGLTGRTNLAQLIISGSSPTIYVDNVYFYSDEGGGGTEPAVAAPTPTVPEADVISLFSDAYTDVPVDTWSADFDDADLADIEIEGNPTKLYTNLVFSVAEFTSQPVDATEMTHFHMDVWTPDPTADPAVFRIKLVDFGPDGEFGGGDDSEHEISLNNTTTPAMTTGAWAALDIPLADFTGLTGTGAIAQLILSGDPNTVYVDNVYFYRTGGGGDVPLVAAPTPTVPEADVVSMFSNAYTDVLVDTWSVDFDQADVEDVQVAGDDTKLYTNLVFSIAEATTQPIDATQMTDFHMDIWTPDPSAAPAVFRIKLVDFGPDGAFGGGDDSEHELTFDATTTPALATGEWVSFDLPLADFTGLTGTGAIAQLILSGDPNTVYVDNVYFYR
ncbi:MAG: hypothetical protein M8872_01525, partial [marine benthic group bacterium]|nr:hypothetical protein [Gemmatimonadota bacterium]